MKGLMWEVASCVFTQWPRQVSPAWGMDQVLHRTCRLLMDLKIDLPSGLPSCPVHFLRASREGSWGN